MSVHTLNIFLTGCYTIYKVIEPTNNNLSECLLIFILVNYTKLILGLDILYISKKCKIYSTRIIYYTTIFLPFSLTISSVYILLIYTIIKYVLYITIAYVLYTTWSQLNRIIYTSIYDKYEKLHNSVHNLSITSKKSINLFKKNQLDNIQRDIKFYLVRRKKLLLLKKCITILYVIDIIYKSSLYYIINSILIYHMTNEYININNLVI